MSREPTWSAAQLRLLLDALVELGLDREELYASCGIEPDTVLDASARVERSLSTRVWSEAARCVGRPHLGLRLAEHARPRAAGVLSYLMMSSATLREGLERAVSHQALLDESSAMELRAEGEYLFLSMGFGTPEHPATIDQIEYRIAMLAKFLAWMSDGGVRPVETRLARAAPADPSLHARTFGGCIRFDAAESGLLLRVADLERPSPHANPELERAHAAAAARAVADLATGSFADRVRAVVVADLERGVPTLGEAARRLHMSPRTLQRRLFAEGTTYHETVDALRRELTLDRLERGGTPIREIATAGGFSDVSAFYRAFKRWTGQTPRSYSRGAATYPAV